MAALELVRAAESARGTGEPVCVSGLACHVGATVDGQYILREARDVIDGMPHLQLALADATGRVSAFIWPEWRDDVKMPPVGCPVSVTAEVRPYQSSQQLRVHRLLPLTAANVQDIANLLPGLADPVRDALRAMDHSLAPVWRQFVARVLLDPKIGPAFLTCRASVHHHHAGTGGLVAHSVENLDVLRTLAARLMPRDPVAPDIIQIAYLFHDIGKLRSVGTATRPRFAFAVGHEFLNVTVLAEHLTWLEQVGPVLHAGLLAMFEYLATPARARSTDAYLPARVVAAFDRWSAAAFDGTDLGTYVRRGPRTRPHRFGAGRWHGARSRAEDAA